MEISKFFKSNLIFNSLLLISFSISVNNFNSFPNINIIFYIFFHLSLIYFLFYHYNYSIYFIFLTYGILLDIFLLNEIGTHLLTYIILIFTYILTKKNLFQLSSNQISLTIFFTLLFVLLFELLISYYLDIFQPNLLIVIKFIIISAIIFIPSIFLFNRIDR